MTRKITPFLWFDGKAEEAANFYVSIFDNAKILEISRYPEGSPGPAGTVMTVQFELDGQPFIALNGGPMFTFNEAISLQVHCDSQEEIDHYWEKLSAGGDASAQQCGWLKDRYGVSWQVVPRDMDALFKDAESPGAQRAMNAMLGMKKLDIAELRRARDASR